MNRKRFWRESDNQDKQEMAKMIFYNEIKLNTERKRDLTQNLTILWATIMGQCTPALKEEVCGDPDYPEHSAVLIVYGCCRHSRRSLQESSKPQIVVS